MATQRLEARSCRAPQLVHPWPAPGTQSKAVYTLPNEQSSIVRSSLREVIETNVGVAMERASPVS